MEWLGFASTGIIILASVTGGILMIINTVKGKTREVQGEENNLEERVRKLYKEQSEVQSKKITEQDSKITELITTLDTLKGDVQRLTGENNTLRVVLQGQDAESKIFRERMVIAAEKTDAILKSINLLALIMEKHIVTDEKVITTRTTTEVKGGVTNNV